ncbi:MAG: lipoyl domain-containing protein [Candidatus Omnitrophota bacterium]
MTEVKVPDLGEEIKKVTIASWLCKSGDHVKSGDDLVELVTDKASFAIDAPASGVIHKILLKEGSEASIGDVLALIQ